MNIECGTSLASESLTPFCWWIQSSLRQYHICWFFLPPARNKNTTEKNDWGTEKNNSKAKYEHFYWAMIVWKDMIVVFRQWFYFSTVVASFYPCSCFLRYKNARLPQPDDSYRVRIEFWHIRLVMCFAKHFLVIIEIYFQTCTGEFFLPTTPPALASAGCCAAAANIISTSSV